ncbi:hypothetical protein BJS_08309 [Bradyrhizobium japonicum SEMIA 5079]|uniref:ID330 n=3 Tax=Bradyrhizobium TaxID=374 RepID=Q9ANC6_BRAJP|nr:ID330 [Bradyrhizobium japonicum]AHY48463.1 hypothetical protein BJS_08309 [Bradyrhizobium japonicum SEMIA 5079]KGJ66100.1 hypothetical protein BJA5080_08311 [Bradyrhizobium diazoefficiens SEMIA 5080]
MRIEPRAAAAPSAAASLCRSFTLADGASRAFLFSKDDQSHCSLQPAGDGSPIAQLQHRRTLGKRRKPFQTATLPLRPELLHDVKLRQFSG